MKIQMVLALAAWVINSTTIMAQETIKQTAGRDQLGDFAPKFAELKEVFIRIYAIMIKIHCY